MNIQREKVLTLLQNAGSRGVNSWDLTYLHAVKQAPTRISEIKDLGYSIKTRHEKNKSVTYFLVGGSRMPVEAPKDEEMVDVPYQKDGYDFIKQVPKSSLKPEQMSLL